ncbi:MAG: nitroreductase [Bacteroidetes bacterium]|nr:nitroreductase [Bacteroidota bacterium]
MNLIDALNWRYATKRMTGAKVPDETIHRILDAARLSASSMGFQPYTILVISNEDVKKKLHPASFNQPQVIESSHLLVFCAWADYGEKEVDEYMANIAKTRNMDVALLDGFKQAVMGAVNGKSPEEKFNWAARQAYIALGTTLAAAALEQVDANGMEGFNPAQVDEALGLKEKNLRSLAYVAIGYRSAEDQLQFAAKVRREKDKLFHFLN